MKVHPAADLLPKMSPEEYNALRHSLKGGYDPRFPIITHGGEILDGRHRAWACEELGIEAPTEPYRGSDPVAFVIKANLARRHLSVSQRAAIGARLSRLGKGQRKADAPIGALSQTDAAKLLNVSRREVQRAAKIQQAEGGERLITRVASGELTIPQALKQVPRRVSLPLLKTEEAPTFYLIEAWEALSKAERAKIIAEGFEHGTGGLNEQTGDSIEWARWSQNTVRGCEHNCPYCYARDIDRRQYPELDFKPRFIPGRLRGPQNQKFPEEREREDYAWGNIFIDSMSDLFGAWVPADWIEATIEMARRSPQWRFLCLTKFPQRAADFTFPKNWWMGTSVDAQSRVANAEKAFAKIKTGTPWLSCEPLLQRLTFERLDVFKWIVPGGASAGEQTPQWVPPFDWVAELTLAAHQAGCRVFHKTNLYLGDEIRLREFPWVEPAVRELPEALRYLKGL